MLFLLAWSAARRIRLGKQTHSFARSGGSTPGKPLHHKDTEAGMSKRDIIATGMHYMKRWAETGTAVCEVLGIRVAVDVEFALSLWSAETIPRTD